MAEYKYAFQKFNKELMSRAVGRDLGISSKQSIEICNYLRHRKLQQAKKILERVIAQEQAIPFKRFTNGLGHKPGKMSAGRYPLKASEAILNLLESAEANAQAKGLNTGELEIIHMAAHRAAKQMHYGRHHGMKFKRTHVEVVLQETAKDAAKVAKKDKPKHNQDKAARQEDRK
jgi:large subunit ribosomal protein L22